MKTKTFLGIFSALAILTLSSSEALAVPNLRLASLKTTDQTVVVSQNAIDNSPVFQAVPLGFAIDPQTGKQVEGIKFIHYKKGYGHKPNHNPGNGGGDATTCYSYLASGAKWKNIEGWTMNAANTEGLDSAALFALQEAALEKWDAAAGAPIFESGTSTSEPLVADETSPDAVNEVYFGSIDSPGAIAVTIVWGIFGGPPFQRQLVEWDQIYDQVDFEWSAEAGGVAGKMDFDNIATHEDGHAAGMGHPSNTCIDETMYAYADFGETKKRDLNAGDIAGIDKLY
ncbi:MAG: matrixin family metalloprotease [bacterium]|nr:matrixin family metalloprotease [bacterium]